jgi:lipase chaperone LimK
MTTTRRTLADLDQPYRAAEKRLTALLCERQSIERDVALSGLDAQAEYYRKVAADERKLAIMNAQRIEVG